MEELPAADSSSSSAVVILGVPIDSVDGGNSGMILAADSQEVCVFLSVFVKILLCKSTMPLMKRMIHNARSLLNPFRGRLADELLS
jgi:hypothetical protein